MNAQKDFAARELVEPRNKAHNLVQMEWLDLPQCFPGRRRQRHATAGRRGNGGGRAHPVLLSVVSVSS